MRLQDLFFFIEITAKHLNKQIIDNWLPDLFKSFNKLAFLALLIRLISKILLFSSLLLAICHNLRDFNVIKAYNSKKK